MKQIFVGVILIVVAVMTLWYFAKREPTQPLTAMELGRKLVEEGSCRGCHQVGSGFRAPRLEGLFGRERTLQNGLKIKADEVYILESLLEPEAKIVAGYTAVMPSFKGTYQQRDLMAIVAYLKTLHESQK